MTRRKNFQHVFLCWNQKWGRERSRKEKFHKVFFSMQRWKLKNWGTLWADWERLWKMQLSNVVNIFAMISIECVQFNLCCCFWVTNSVIYKMYVWTNIKLSQHTIFFHFLNGKCWDKRFQLWTEKIETAKQTFILCD